MKFFRRFPNVERQINRLVLTLKSVGTLGFLLLLFLVVYSILGMNLFGGRMYESATWQNVGYGELVYVRLPEDSLPSYLPGRPGVVKEIDIDGHPARPYKVHLTSSFTIFGDALPEAQVWCGLAANGPYTAGIGVPAISSKLPRTNFDGFLASLLSVFQVLTQTGWQFIMYNVVTTTGPWSSLYFYSLLFFGNYVLLNIFIGIVIVGFGDSQGQLQVVQRQNRELAARRMEGQLMLRDLVLRTLSIEMCNFPGPRCEVEGISVWNLLPFRIDDVNTLDQETGRPIVKKEVNYDFVEIKASVRRIAEILLGMLDLTSIAIEKAPTVSDIRHILLELRQMKIATKRQRGGFVETKVSNELSRAKSAPTSDLYRIVPCLLEAVKGRYESHTYIAVEYLYRFWDGVENRKAKEVSDAVRRTPMTQTQMESAMRAMIASKELKVMAQARLNAGDVQGNDISGLQLAFPDGKSRCQGVIGLNSQCPNPLSCPEHRAVNQRFLLSFQVLKSNVDARSREGPIDQTSQEVKLQHLEFALQSMRSGATSSQFGVPYRVCWHLTWSFPLRYYAGKVILRPHQRRASAAHARCCSLVRP